MIKIISKNVDELKDLMTQKDCKKLKELIISNPDAPLLIFVGGEAWSGDVCCESVAAGDSVIKEITIYDDNQWLYKDEYEETIRDDMADDEDYDNLSSDEFDAEVEKIIAETAFVKAIIIYVG